MSRFSERFFRAPIEVFDAIRQAADAAWGLPANGQRTAIAPVECCPVVDGLVYMCVRADHCNYPPFDVQLPEMLASGAVYEISEADYWAACADLPSPV